MREDLVAEPALCHHGSTAPNVAAVRSEKSGLGLFRRRAILLPTWKGTFLMLVTAGAILSTLVLGIYPFLTPQDSKPGGILVIEGWAQDWAMQDAISEFERNRYDALYVTGGPIEKGAPLSEYGSIAELGYQTIRKLRPDLQNVGVAPAPQVQKDRTYASALALRQLLEAKQLSGRTINLISVGPHSRRSRMLFQAAFKGSAEVGVIALDEREFDPKSWWTSSQGFRSVTSEAIAYLYAALLFRPDGS